MLIFDEVITFRLGYRGAQGMWGIDPDLTTLGKIMGGGFPVGAVGGAQGIHGGVRSRVRQAGVAARRNVLGQSRHHARGPRGDGDAGRGGLRRLDVIGDAVRAGIDEAFRRNGVPGGTVGLGSLLKIHFADRPIRDYRSAYMTEQETKRQSIFNRGLLNRGVLAAGYGLMALSTPMTDADVDAIIVAAAGAMADVSALA